MKKVRQILALVGVVLLVLLFILVLITALFDDPGKYKLFGAAVVAMISVPVIIWILGMFIRLAEGKGQINLPEEETPEDTANITEIKGDDDGTS